MVNDNRLLHLYNDINSLVNNPPDKFCEKAVLCIRKRLDLKAVAMYSLVPHRKVPHKKDPRENLLVLRAQAGFEYAEYKSFILTSHSFMGQCVKKKSIHKTKNIIDESNDAAEKDQITCYGLKYALAAPLWSQKAFEAILGNECKNDKVAAVLGVYLEGGDELDRLAEIFGHLREVLSLAYVNALNCYYVNFRTEMTELIAASHNYDALLENINRSISEKLPAQASSCFIYNSKSAALELEHSTTKFENIKGEVLDTPEQVCYRETDQARTWRAFRESKIDSDWNQPGLKLHTYREEIEGTIKGMLWVPIRRHGPHKNGDPIGVVRVVNRVITHADKSEVVPFSWEDEQLVTFAADIVFVIAHLFKASEARFRTLERMTHGLTTTITSTIARLSALRGSENIQRALANWKEDKHRLEDSIFLLEDIYAQFMRISRKNGATLSPKTVLLAANILMPAVKMIDSMARTRDLIPIMPDLSAKNYFTEMGPSEIFGDEAAIMSVFRNLIENAFKYRKKGERFVKIDMDFKNYSDKVAVYFDSWGIGILDNEQEAIFEEGYRGTRAMMINPGGTGYGLTQAREIMQKMGGNLAYMPLNDPEAPTRFILTFRKYQRQDG